MTMGTQTRLNSNVSYIKKYWTQDKGTYPVVVVISGALLLCTYRCTVAMFSNKDVRITPTARQELFRPH